MSTAPARRLACALLVLALGQGCGRRVAPPAAPPNLLLITVDTLRADRLGCYGYARAETPTLDRLAREGVRFERAYSPLPLTLPAHASLLTGLEPPSHGLQDNGQNRAQLGAPTLAERLGPRGYDTAAFVAAFVLNRAFGLDRGFALYDDGPPEESELEGLFRRTAPAEERVEALLAWLARPRPGPFFAWLHLYDPHAPHVAPPPFAERFASRPYDGEVAYVDAQLRRVLDVLEARGLARDTLVVLASDHGEGLGEHGEESHGLLLYDSTLRVPLLWRWPGHIAPGQVERAPVTLSDVVPTLLRLLGVPSEPGLPGVALFGSAPRFDRPLPAWSDAGRRRFGWASLRALRRGTLKLIAGPSDELYDLERDPGETHDLAGSRPQEVAELRQDLGRELARHTPAAGAAQGPSEEQRARLAALGYVQAEVAPAPSGAVDPKAGLTQVAGLERALASFERGPEGVAQAERELRSLTARYPANGWLQMAHARALDLSGRLEEAQAAYARAAQDEGTRLLALSRLADLAHAQGRVEQGLAWSERLVSAYPRLASAQRRRAVALHAVGRLREAEAAYELALSLDPRSWRARAGWARLLSQSGRAGEAAHAAAELCEQHGAQAEVAALCPPSPAPPRGAGRH